MVGGVRGGGAAGSSPLSQAERNRNWLAWELLPRQTAGEGFDPCRVLLRPCWGQLSCTCLGLERTAGGGHTWGNLAGTQQVWALPGWKSVCASLPRWMQLCLHPSRCRHSGVGRGPPWGVRPGGWLGAGEGGRREEGAGASHRNKRAPQVSAQSVDRSRWEKRQTGSPTAPREAPPQEVRA